MGKLAENIMMKSALELIVRLCEDPNNRGNHNTIQMSEFLDKIRGTCLVALGKYQ